jgi:hypothetical protein
MMNDQVRAYFEHSAKTCGEMGSPFTERLLRVAVSTLNRETQTGRRVLDWPGDPHPDALALRLAGGLHALALSGMDRDLSAAYPPDAAIDLESAVSAAIIRHDAWLSTWLDNPPQTNETGRSAVLLPGFLAIARETGLPLALAEIGSSAGLNLFFDRFRYRYGEADWGDPLYPVTLMPQMRGAIPDLRGDLKIASRAGSDIAPLDLDDEGDRLRLRAYIWADQSERLARLDAAILVARQGASRKGGECLVLFHSVVCQYLPEHTKLAIQTAMRRAGAEAGPDAPLAWLAMETLKNTDPHPVLQLTLWPGGQTRTLALADFHGRWMEWL